MGKEGPIAEKHDARGDSRRLSASFVMVVSPPASTSRATAPNRLYRSLYKIIQYVIANQERPQRGATQVPRFRRLYAKPWPSVPRPGPNTITGSPRFCPSEGLITPERQGLCSLRGGCHITLGATRMGGDTLPSSITYHEQLGEKQSDHHDQIYLLSGGARHAGNRRGVFPGGPSCANTFAWRGKNERSASRKNAICVDASYVCNRANALFSARTARTGRPASRIARELCEATPLKSCRRRPCGWCPADGDADRLEVTEWPRHHREHDGNAALCARR